MAGVRQNMRVRIPSNGIIYTGCAYCTDPLVESTARPKDGLSVDI